MLTLKDARFRRGLKMYAVADAIGVTRQTYARYEEHPGAMPLEKAMAACEFIGCDVSEIFLGEKSSKTYPAAID